MSVFLLNEKGVALMTQAGFYYELINLPNFKVNGKNKIERRWFRNGYEIDEECARAIMIVSRHSP